MSTSTKGRVACGIDSIDSIDKTITNIVFPNTSQICNKQIDILNEIPGHTFKFVESVNKNNISMLEIIPQKLAQHPKVIIYSHGNGENIWLSRNIARNIANKSGNIFIIYDYIGYGASDGNSKPSEEGCYESIDTVINYVKNHLSQYEILLIGYSLGTGVVMEYVTKEKWTNPIILMAAYKSIPRVVWDCSMTRVILGHNNFESINKIHKIRCPVLFFHGKSDKLISWHHTRDLHDNLPIEYKKYAPIYIEKAEHNDLLNYLDSNVINFICNEIELINKSINQ